MKKYGFISNWESDNKYNYWGYWDELLEVAKNEKIEGTDNWDVRCGGGLLDRLGIPNTECFAYEDDDDRGWRLAWK